MILWAEPGPGGLPMRVSQIMTRHLVTVSMDDTVEHMQRLFENHRFHHLLVFDYDAGKVVGVISDRDLLRNLSPFIGKMSERTQDLSLLQRRAHQIMSRTPITIGEVTSVVEACGIMVRKHVSCLPVTAENSDRVVGIVTWRDLLRWSAQHCGAEPGAACDARGAA